MVILTFAYILGMMWQIMITLIVDIMNDDWINTTESGTDGLPFIQYYGLQSKTPEELTIINFYWAFTSLSTVGFGDYVPRSDIERVVGAFILLSGVAVFSYIMGNFIDILNQYKEYKSDNGEDDLLNRFFGTI